MTTQTSPSSDMEADGVSIWPRMEPFLLGPLQVRTLRVMSPMTASHPSYTKQSCCRCR